jgi:hypothetical protein
VEEEAFRKKGKRKYELLTEKMTAAMAAVREVLVQGQGQTCGMEGGAGSDCDPLAGAGSAEMECTVGGVTTLMGFHGTFSPDMSALGLSKVAKDLLRGKVTERSELMHLHTTTHGTKRQAWEGEEAPAAVTKTQAEKLAEYKEKNATGGSSSSSSGGGSNGSGLGGATRRAVPRDRSESGQSSNGGPTRVPRSNGGGILSGGGGNDGSGNGCGGLSRLGPASKERIGRGARGGGGGGGAVSCPLPAKAKTMGSAVRAAARVQNKNPFGDITNSDTAMSDIESF